MARTRQICSECRKIFTSGLFTNQLKHEDAIALGRLGDIIDNKGCGCSFCALIVSSLRAQQPWQRFDTERTLELLLADGDDTNVWLYSYVFMKDEFPILRIGLSTNKEDQVNRRGRRKHVGDVQILHSSAVHYGLKPEGRGRRMTATTDMALARAWLEECLTDHGLLCSNPGSREGHPHDTANPTRLRVIDVRKRCLVSLPDGADYVALSYCWPKQPGLCNTSTSGVDLREEGAISISNGLSTTIYDACDAVNDLGEQYIWVDALCIVQDDNEDKAHQISQMDLVYGKALLTIVVCPSNKNSETSELPGYRSSPSARRQKVYRAPYQDIDLVVPKPCLEDILAYTRWETRGWTFQESHLSRRSLYFTDHQLYFQCSCGMRCEDTNGEGHAPGAYIKHSTNLWNPKNAHTADKEANHDEMYLNRTRYDDDNEALSAYDSFISAYLRRELSFGSDILNAFHGIAKIMSISMETEFYAGLPVKWLDHALLWQLYGTGERRLDFPSFSWAGWLGGADAPYWLNAESTRKLIKWYHLDGSKWMECKSEGQIEELAGSPRAIPEPELSILPSTKSAFPWSLATMTQVASFKLSTQPVDVTGAAMWSHGEHTWILDTNLRRAGLILIDKTWETKNITEHGQHDFVLLSRSKMGRVNDMPNFDDTCFEQRKWCLLNIMLVVWRDDRTAERIAVGTMHCDAWIAAEPDNKTVQLV
jgi:hypothetical protein